MAEPAGREFRDAMRAFVGNCSVLTVGEGDEASGLVVTSVVSPSSDPPLLLACIGSTASSLPLLRRHGWFGWSSLGAAHQAVAERFSGFGGVKGAARYAGAEWEIAETGARLLRGAPVAFDCTVEELIDRDSHTILIGRVRSIRSTAGAGALIWWQNGFRPLT